MCSETNKPQNNIGSSPTVLITVNTYTLQLLLLEYLPLIVLRDQLPKFDIRLNRNLMHGQSGIDPYGEMLQEGEGARELHQAK
jgi:hypothetical protein